MSRIFKKLNFEHFASENLEWTKIRQNEALWSCLNGTGKYFFKKGLFTNYVDKIGLNSKFLRIETHQRKYFDVVSVHRASF